jgi:hypothetical protein
LPIKTNMKANHLKVLSVVGLSVGVLAAQTLTAADTTQSTSYRKTFMSTPALEYPSTAANLVKKATDQEKSAVTMNVVKAAVLANPATASAVVAEISRTNPDMAAVAAGIAAANQPFEAHTIAKAAATAAPAKAAAIAASVSREVPHFYGRIAVSVAQAAPKYSHDILVATADYAPSVVKTDLQASSSRYDSPVSVAVFLTSKSVYLAPPPVVGNSFVNPSGTYTTKDLRDTTIAPPAYGGYGKP